MPLNFILDLFLQITSMFFSETCWNCFRAPPRCKSDIFKHCISLPFSRGITFEFWLIQALKIAKIFIFVPSKLSELHSWKHCRFGSHCKLLERWNASWTVTQFLWPNFFFGHLNFFPPQWPGVLFYGSTHEIHHLSILKKYALM